jgi:DNA-binding transcriptional ArsR family regulator
LTKERNSTALSAVFAALADPTRREIMARLSHGPCSVTELAAPFAISAPAISKHLRVLEQAALIERWKSGRVRYCALLPEPLCDASEWIEQQRGFWMRQFAALDQFLDDEAGRWTDPATAPPADAPASFSGSDGASPRRRNGFSRRGRNQRR